MAFKTLEKPVFVVFCTLSHEEFELFEETVTTALL
jgi:hypothetical protein